MKFYKFTYSEKAGDFISKEITEEQAFDYLKVLYIDTECFKGKLFRLKTPYGYIEARTSDGLAPVPGFYGVCD